MKKELKKPIEHWIAVSCYTVTMFFLDLVVFIVDNMLNMSY